MNSIPEKMTAVVWEEVGQLAVKTIEVPKPGRGEALVKIMASGLCITDVHVINGSFAHSKPPCVLGHEIAGQIVAFGEDQPWPHHLKRNQRVVVETMIACGECDQCLSGFKNLCRNGGDIGEPPFQGGYSEYITMPVSCLYPIPDNMSYEEAAIFESFVCPVGGLNRIGCRPGDTVLVLGLGPAGLAFVQAAAVMGAAKIIAVDLKKERLSLAGQYGAHVLVNPSVDSLSEVIEEQTGGCGADVCCEASGSEAGIQSCMDMAKKNGKLIYYGIPSDTHRARFDVTKLITKQLNVFGTSGAPWAWKPTLELYGQGKYNIKDMVTHTFELTEMEQAVKTLLDPCSGAIKVVLKSRRNQEEQ